MEPIYKNPSAPIEDRVADLMSRMTLDEKIHQLSMHFHLGNILEEFDKGNFPELGYATSYMYDNYCPPAYTPTMINRVQKKQVEETRLGIPMMIHGESIHGLMYHGATIFPVPIGMASSFNPDLVGEAANVIGKEMRATGTWQTYAPNIDLSRDPRWGRTEENYGEDPYLTARMAVSYVKNVQKNKVASTLKHFLAHGSPEGGINAAPPAIGERMVRETMLEPFRAAIQEGGALSLMPAYSEIDGIPMHASHYWLTKVLREELGFTGTVVSDSGGIYELYHEQRTSTTPEEAGIAAFMAGIDHELPYPAGYGEGLKKAVEEGRVPMSRIDEAVARNLRMKFQLGLFEEPYLDEETLKANLHAAESVEVARRVANESIVLLKNDGVLPLSKDIRKVAVVGPNCDFPRLGGYTPKGCEAYSVSPLEGIKSIIGEDRIVTAKGCCVAAPSDLDAAIKAAEEADVVVAVLGDNSSAWFARGWGDDEGGNIITCGEGKDTSTLALPDVQKELLRALKKVGKPIVLVLETGRPYAITEENDIANALLAAWYPGEQGGNALADILFGNVNPSGKLPITFPKSVGHIPCFYNYKAMARTPHLDVNAAPNENFDKRKINMAALYEFGFGLSYTTFAYSDLKVEDETVSVKVTNTGDRTGKETVLMYLVHEYCPVTRFVKRLRNFTKIELQPGETKEVTFTIVDEDLSYVDVDYKTAVGTGEFTVLVGDLEAKYYR